MSAAVAHHRPVSPPTQPCKAEPPQPANSLGVPGLVSVQLLRPRAQPSLPPPLPWLSVAVSVGSWFTRTDDPCWAAEATTRRLRRGLALWWFSSRVRLLRRSSLRPLFRLAAIPLRVLVLWLVRSYYFLLLHGGAVGLVPSTARSLVDNARPAELLLVGTVAVVDKAASVAAAAPVAVTTHSMRLLLLVLQQHGHSLS